MLKQAATPPPLWDHQEATAPPEIRTAQLPDIVSVQVSDLFPDIPQEIYLSGPDVSMIREQTEQALAAVDMSMIGPNDSVNVLCSEHGFLLMGGEPYAEMIRTIKDVVQERTGSGRIRLRVCSAVHHYETDVIFKNFKLDEYYEGKARSTGPFDKGIPIETEIGTLYGLASVYDADFFIHCHYDDPREVYLHRLISRTLKSYTMSYARFETRSVFHCNFGTRSSNIVPRAIFESDFIQKKHAFTTFLLTSPAGVIGVDADNHMQGLNERLVVNTLRGYGKLMRLFAAIDECVIVLDDRRYPFYAHAGGLASVNLLKSPTDYLDLDVGPRDRGKVPLNSAIKAVVVNHIWGGMLEPFAYIYPIFVAGQEVCDGLPQVVSTVAQVSKNLETAIMRACGKAGTDKVLVFDGCYGSINLSRALGEFFIKKAPQISKKVEKTLLSKWLRQRGIDPSTARI